MKKIYHTIFVVGFLLFCNDSIVQAISLDFIPASPSVMQGQPLIIALAISGLGDQVAPSLSAFDVDITFNTAILSFVDAVFGDPVLGAQLDLSGFGSSTTKDISPGMLHLAESSFDAPSDLDDFQAGDFTLVTLTFDAIAQGAMTFGLMLNDFGNSAGEMLTEANGDPLTVTPGTGAIMVTPRQSTDIPEPATVTLFGVGLASLLGLSWFRRHLAQS